MNLFIKADDPKKRCDGCRSTYTREGDFGFNCPECESYLTVHEMLGVNFAVHLELWRHRHGLTREAARRVAQDFLDLNEEWVTAGMDGYGISEMRKVAAQKDD
jgi:tRNA(Ile2) C34 agmatinyltransferase TiaS